MKLSRYFLKYYIHSKIALLEKSLSFFTPNRMSFSKRQGDFTFVSPEVSAIHGVSLIVFN